MEQNRITTNCPLCDSLGTLDVVTLPSTIQNMQCISCGYTTSTDYDATNMEFHTAYINIEEKLKQHIKIKNDTFWIPIVMMLPSGAITPSASKDDSLKWNVSLLVDIPEEEQFAYPDSTGGFYQQRYDVEHYVIFDTFKGALNSLIDLNNRIADNRS
jgi:Zn ribbon nucleic-acid-binding protein